MSKRTKIFISHASADKGHVENIVELFEDIGVRKEQLFCSSVPGYDIPLGQDIYEHLKKQFQEFDLHVIFVLSENYYKSVACLNEMGAAWVLQNKYDMILLPNFDFPEIKGAVNPRQISLKLDDNEITVKEKLGQLKNTLIEEFGLSSMADARWERKRDNFIKNVLQNVTDKISISNEALLILDNACKDSHGTIIKIRTLSGTTIAANGRNFIESQDRREVAKWEKALQDLIDNDFVKVLGGKGELYEVTSVGYEYMDNMKEV